MPAGWTTKAIIRVLDWLAAHSLPPEKTPPHQRTGRLGEEAAYFYLEENGLHDGSAEFSIAAAPGRD